MRLGVDDHVGPVLEQVQVSPHFVHCHILPELRTQESGLQLIQQVWGDNKFELPSNPG